MNKRNFVLLFLIFFIVGIGNQGIGQIRTTSIKTVKKVDNFVRTKPYLLSNISYSGSITTSVFSGGNIKKREIDVSMFYNASPLDPDIAKSFKLKVNNVNIPKKNSHQFYLNPWVTGLPLELTNTLILSRKVSSSPVKYKTVFTGNGTINPVTLISPQNNYKYKMSVRDLNSIGKKGVLVSWTASSNAIQITINKIGNSHIRIKHYGPMTGKNSIVIKDSLLEPGSEYQIILHQSCKNLNLNGTFKSGSRIFQYYRRIVYFSTSEGKILGFN